MNRLAVCRSRTGWTLRPRHNAILPLPPRYMATRMPKLILASRSPRRRDLLHEAGYEFEIRPADDSVESGIHRGESPVELVARLARLKAQDVARKVDAGLVIGCDTVAECNGQILGKPADAKDAEWMLRRLSGRRHRVLSGVCLCSRPDDRTIVRVDETTLMMDSLTPRQLDEYLASGGWQGKAGAFGYQDRLGWVRIVEGSESNVVGLPLELLAEMLREMAGG